MTNETYLNIEDGAKCWWIGVPEPVDLSDLPLDGSDPYVEWWINNVGGYRL